MDILRKEKSELRKSVLEKRDSLDISELQSKSQRIMENLFGMESFQKAESIMFFVSFRSEVMTDFMIRETLKMGKNVIAPRTETKAKDLQISFIVDFNSDLTIGAYGILEPRQDSCKRAKASDVDLVIVPGSVFAENGDRIGYGAGYYDRFLGKLKNGTKKIALAFDLQIIDSVPSNNKDVKLDYIVTETRVITCKDA